MKIVLLGAGGYHPNSHRQTTCLLLPDRGLAVDAGTAAFRVEGRLATDELELFLTHAHLDHVVGLTYLLGVFGEPDRLRVHGLPEKLEAVREHLYSEHLFPVAPGASFSERPLPGESGSLELDGGGRVSWFPLKHPGGALGYRFDGLDASAPDKSFAFVTDTTATPDAAYRDHLRGLDLLIHEAYFEDARHGFAVKTGHSCVGDVARLAAEVGAGRLVLTHMNPRVDEREPFDLTAARRVFPAVEFGQDEMEIDL